MLSNLHMFFCVKYILKGNGKHLYVKTILKMKFIPSTMLDLARNPEDVLRAPLNTTKLAPVTDKKKKSLNIAFFFFFLEREQECERGQGHSETDGERDRIPSRLHIQHRAHQRARSHNPEFMT